MERFFHIKSIFKVHPFFYLAAFISTITGNFKMFLYFSLITVVHECGHLSMALFFKWNIKKVLILPFGGLTIFNEDINRPLFQELMIAVFGPLVQIIFTYVFSLFFYDEVFINYSKILLLFNLLPIYPLDGSKILNIFFNYFVSFKKSHLIMIYISFLTMLFVLIIYDFNFILFLILSLLIFKVIEEWGRHLDIFNRFLLERYTKNYKFRKELFIKGGAFKMRRDYRHVFYNGKECITEREMLKKRFDFKGKRW